MTREFSISLERYNKLVVPFTCWGCGEEFLDGNMIVVLRIARDYLRLHQDCCIVLTQQLVQFQSILEEEERIRYN